MSIGDTVVKNSTNYYAGWKRVALAVNGTLCVLGVDGLGSAEVELDGTVRYDAR